MTEAEWKMLRISIEQNTKYIDQLLADVRQLSDKNQLTKEDAIKLTGRVQALETWHKAFTRTIDEAKSVRADWTKEILLVVLSVVLTLVATFYGGAQ